MTPRSLRRHSFVSELLDRLLVLREMRQPHAAQHVWRLGELDIVVADDLDPVAPGIDKIEEAPRQPLDPGIGERRAHRLLFIHHQPEMPAVIGRLPAPLLQREELIAKIDESRVLALAAQLELEEPAVKRQRLFDVADLEGDVIETDGPRLLCLGHSLLSVSGSSNACAALVQKEPRGALSAPQHRRSPSRLSWLADACVLTRPFNPTPHFLQSTRAGSGTARRRAPRMQNVPGASGPR